MEKITTEINNGEKVVIKGFGFFSDIERAARKGRKTQTGE